MKKNVLIIAILLFQTHFSMSQSVGHFFDERDNKTYRIVHIGNQTWMAENLNFYTEQGSWCFDNSGKNCAQFGRLYNFETAQNVCLKGWRLPEKKDYDELLKYLQTQTDMLFQSLSMGGSAGFDALLAGWRGINGNYYAKGLDERFWTSTELHSHNAWFLHILKEINLVQTDYDNKELGLSVRCIKE
jgi:uncharacterized protein (TIGR02145 family)